MRLMTLITTLCLTTPAFADCAGGFYQFEDQCLSLDSLTSEGPGSYPLPFIAPPDHDPLTSGPLPVGAHYTPWSADDHFDEYGNPAPMNEHGWDGAGNYHNIIGDGHPMDSLDDNDNGVYDPEELAGI